MKIKKFSVLLISLSITISLRCAAQPSSRYFSYIDTAKTLSKHKEFLKAAKYYTFAFNSNHNLGLVNHRYEAAQCWALEKQSDSAFFHLDKCVKGNYDSYEDLRTDLAFVSIRSDRRWAGILQGVKQNQLTTQQRNDQHLNKLNHHLIKVLDSMLEDDQLPRLRMAETEKKYGWSSTQMRDNIKEMTTKDSLNTKKLRFVLDKYGWLEKEEISQRGVNALILVLQHSNLATQKRYLPLLKSAVKEHKADPSNLALLEDRVAIKEGREQEYGSQIIRNDKTGGYIVDRLKDPKNVDKRRAAVGLPPLKDYVKQWGIIWSVEQYEKDLEILRQ